MAAYTRQQADDALGWIASATSAIENALNPVCDVRDGSAENILTDILSDLNEVQQDIESKVDLP